MQRRAAAAYFLFFLVVSIGAYTIDATAVTVMSALAGILLLGLSYLPVRG